MRKEKNREMYCGSLEEAIGAKERLQEKGYIIISTEIGSSVAGNWIKMVYKKEED